MATFQKNIAEIRTKLQGIIGKKVWGSKTWNRNVCDYGVWATHSAKTSW